ncbi:MAG: hypothetical protein R3E48_11205 [Burkholderiaceae bacterium]
MKNITLSADEKLIEAARARARAENTTLNDRFREWLAAYAQEAGRMRDYDAVISRIRGQMQVGRKLSRDEMNER